MHKLKQQLLSPKFFYKTSTKILPWLSLTCFVLLTYGFICGLFFAPMDYQQGNTFRIIYVHVPSAFTAMFIYVCMGICAIISYVWRIKLAAIAMSASASIGAWFTFLALITGSLWGKPMWGTWWIWDARLTSVLILFFLYMGFLSLQSAIPNEDYRDKACALLAIIGLINIPIIHYSVTWWNTLHQGPTLAKLALPSIDNSMLYPLLSMIVAFLLFYSIILLIRMQGIIILRERKNSWVKEMLTQQQSR